jgi:2,4-dienoyl-CoA reductase-like NADH-dependent reductase (Old Yellow Enzyme family)
MSTTPSPFDPIQIGPITLRNRFIKSGANEGMCMNGAPTKALVKHHRDLAFGGVGMTTCAYFSISAEGRTLANQTWLRRDILPDLRALTDGVHEGGAAISAQITHGGSFTQVPLKGAAMSSSPGINKAGLMKGNFFQRAMNEADMEKVTEEFVTGAKLCREAGFDAVEIHMGHGYLLNQFISPLSNKRRDQYGGSAENRVRFPARVLARVKAAVGNDMAIVAKINVADGVPGGATAADGMVTARALEAAGADLLVLSGGRNIESTWFMFGSPMNQDEFGQVLKGDPLSRFFMKLAALNTPKGLTFHEMYLLEYSRQIRAAVKMPLAYLGGAKSLENAEMAMREGFDCGVMARALIHDTGLINKFRDGSVTHSGCTSCNGCIPHIYDPAGTCCILNPPNDLALNQVAASAP